MAKDARGRATNQALMEAATILGQVATQTLFNVATQEMSGGKVDLGNAAAAGLWSNIDAVDTAAAVGRVVHAYSGGELTATAAQSITISQQALQQGQNPATVAGAVATVISTAAGAPPAK